MNGLIKFLLWTAGILGAIGGFLYLTLLDFWRLPTDDAQLSVSVEPTLSAGDLVLVTRHGTPSVPYLVRCTDPDAPGRFVVGRIVGGGGDKVDLINESLTVNGGHAPSPRACVTSTVTLTNPATNSEETLNCRETEFGGITHQVLALSDHPEPGKSTQVESGKVYLVSDNHHMHLDSRDFGPVLPSSCQHIVARVWSRDGFGDDKHRFTFIW
jgi:signal peptidase I